MHKIIEYHLAGIVGNLLTVEEPDGTLTTLPPDEMEKYVQNRRPVVYRGMTLDELFKPFAEMQEATETGRAQGLWDEELWGNVSLEFKEYLDQNWDWLMQWMKPETK